MATNSTAERRISTPLDRLLAELAVGQHGVVSLKQLIALGLSRSAIRRRVIAGKLHQLHPGVYAVGHPLVSWRGRLMAGVLYAGEWAVVSHLSAAALWDLLPSASPAIRVTVPRGGRRSRPGVRVHQTRQLDAADRVVIDAVPVTSLARTLVDIAGVVTPARLEQAIEQAERKGQLDRKAIERVLRRGRPGARALNAALIALDPLAPQAHLGLERRFLKLIRQARLPRPQLNVVVGQHEVDFLWEDHKLIVELDSLEFHRTPTAFEADRKRDIDLKRAGYTVLRITHRRLKEEPAAVIQELRYFLSACAP